MIAISPARLRAGKIYDDFLAALPQADAESGAVVSFTGRARKLEQGKPVAALHLEHYPGMSERLLARAAGQAREKFSLTSVWISHRVGRILPGELILMLLLAAEHRRPALHAGLWLMDWLKREAPFWKKAEMEDGGDYWIAPEKQPPPPPKG